MPPSRDQHLGQQSHRKRSSSVGSASSVSSDGSHPRGGRKSKDKNNNTLDPPILVYHESARSIVFRDQARRSSYNHNSSTDSLDLDRSTGRVEEVDEEEKDDGHNDVHHNTFSDIAGMLIPSTVPDNFNQENVQIMGYQPNIVPLPKLELGPNDEFTPLLESGKNDQIQDNWTDAEKEVFQLLRDQMAVVKTIKNCDWTAFLHRFGTPHANRARCPDDHNDIPASDEYPFNSFVTSTSMLPSLGKKMRCFGASSVYTTGVVFALPNIHPKDEDEDAAQKRTRTWSWPSGYSAKTEFNIDGQGNLINGRQEALVDLSQLRQLNDDYLHKEDYVIAGRMVKGGLQTVPYNEVFVRVGGLGHIVNGKDCATGQERKDEDGTGRSFDRGVGLPVALFVRTCTFGHLISMFRTRARLMHVLGEENIQKIPLLLISPQLGTRVLTESLQKDILKIAARNLNPFQNPLLACKTRIDDTSESHLETKLEELIDLDDSIRHTLTPEECARLAGGFGATDESIATILKEAMIQDKQSESGENGKTPTESHKLQDIVNEGLAAAVRSGDYYTSRQLLILYSLIASEGHKMDQQGGHVKAKAKKLVKPKSSMEVSDVALLKNQLAGTNGSTDVSNTLPPPPPPPPLDTDRLRSATNSDGLLAVLGAAQVLKAMRDGGARKRTEECVLAVEEWVEHGEQSMAFRLASWRDQRAAQGDLKIATDKDSSFMAFVSTKAISNRKNFAKQLRDAVSQTDFTDIRFLHAIFEIASRMHSPCLRLELLQYVLGLDNRYSVAHVKRSIELAATCLSISATTPEEN